MILLLLLASMNAEEGSNQQSPLSFLNGPSIEGEPSEPSASNRLCVDVMGRTVECNPYSREDVERWQQAGR